MPEDDDEDMKIKAMALSPTGITRRTFFDRTFSPLSKGSVRGSIFALSASAVGSGVLSLPYVLALCGWAGGLTFMCVAYIAAKITLSMLASMACEHNLPNYSKIVDKAGGKWGTRLLSLLIILFMFGACIAYQIISTSLFRYVVK